MASDLAADMALSAADLTLGAADLTLPTTTAVHGRVLGEAGAAIDNVQVLACSAISCEFGRSATDGTFYIQVPDDPINMVIKTPEDDTQTPSRAESVAPIKVETDVNLAVGTLYVPNLPLPTRLGPVANDPQTVTIGDGLTLTLNRADLLPPLDYTDNELAARQVPLVHVPPLPGIAANQLVAVYAISPFSMQSKSKIKIRAPSTLPAGTKVSFRTVSEVDGTLSPPEMGTADGTSVSTAAGAGVVDLTWLIISR